MSLKKVHENQPKDFKFTDENLKMAEEILKRYPEKNKNMWSILNDIDKKDEIKFVIGDKEDYDWSRSKINRYKLYDKCQILFSPVYGKIDMKDLCDWVLSDGLKVRLQTQLHKFIWGPDKKGV